MAGAKEWESADLEREKKKESSFCEQKEAKKLYHIGTVRMVIRSFRTGPM